tara:strand:- start:6352 stop:6516 length:165 start_codon:yes stop_codon:yes gene_type:complete
MGVLMVVAVSPVSMAVMMLVRWHPVAMGVWAMGMMFISICLVCHGWCAKKHTTS